MVPRDPEVEAARERARASRHHGVTRPDPVSLPELRDPGFANPDPAKASGPETVGDFIPDSYHYHPSESLTAWTDIWSRDLRFRFSSHRGGLLGRAIVAAKRVLAHVWRAPLSDRLQRERVFSLVLLRRLEALTSEIRMYFRDVRDPYRFLQDKAIPQMVARTDSLFAILDQRIEALEAELLRLRQEQAVPGRSVVTAARSVSVAPTPSIAPAADDDPAYFSFEALHRGTEAEIRARQSDYVKVFAGRSKVVDLGCGRGEMLGLLREAGIAAYGVDLNSAMVSRSSSNGIEVVQDDALRHLESLDDASLGGVFSAQTFEHWERDRIVSAVRLIYQKLADGAPFVMETQNPQSLVVGASEFWRDLTHVRPIHPDAFEFLVRAVGFRDVELRMLSPYDASDRLPRVRSPRHADDSNRLLADDVNRVVDELDRRLFGYRDYAVIARK